MEVLVPEAHRLAFTRLPTPRAGNFTCNHPEGATQLQVDMGEIIDYNMIQHVTHSFLFIPRLEIIFLFAWSNFAIHCLCLRSNFNKLISNYRWFPALTVGGSDNSARPHARGPGTSLARDRLRSSNVGGNCFFLR